MNSKTTLLRRLKSLERRADASESGSPAFEDPFWPLAVFGDPTRAQALYFVTKPALPRLVGTSAKGEQCLFLTRHGIPSQATLKTAEWISRMLDLHVCFIGDLNAQDLAAFMTFDAFLKKRRRKLLYAGVSDPWITLGRSSLKTHMVMDSLFVPQSSIDRERWQLTKRLYPQLKTLIGREGTSLLDRGLSLAQEAVCNRAFFRRGYKERVTALLLSQGRLAD